MFKVISMNEQGGIAIAFVRGKVNAEELLGLLQADGLTSWIQ